MIGIDEINSEIEKLEAQVPTYQTIERLAALYTVRDHSAHMGTTALRVEPTSPFMALCDGKCSRDVMRTMDELMSTLEVLMPRLYSGVMQALKD